MKDAASTESNLKSLSARRAWIEILPREHEGGLERGRSPQGERG